MNTDRFKYRYWNKEKNIMEPVSAFSIYETIHGEPRIALYNPNCNAFNYNYDAACLMQCTGIITKENIALFEGDIIRSIDARSDIYEVIWDDNFAAWTGRSLNNNNYCTLHSDNLICIGHRYDGESHQ